MSDLMLLRIDAHPDPMMGLLPMFLAIDRGLFRAQGIETRFVQRTADQAIEDMRAGRMDLSFSGPTLTIMVAERFGLPSRVVAPSAIRGSVGDRSGDFMNLLARKDLAIRKPSDFEGKRLAVFALDGGITHSAPLYHFRRHGIDLDSIEWKTMPFHRMPQALAQGEVDVAICVEPLITLMRERGLGEPVDEVLGEGSLAMSTTGNPSLVSNWWTTREAYERQPALFDATTSILAQAGELAYQEPDAAFQAMASHTGKDVALLRRIGFASSFFHPFEHGAPEVRTMYRNWAKVLQGAGLLERPVDIDQFF